MLNNVHNTKHWNLKAMKYNTVCTLYSIDTCRISKKKSLTWIREYACIFKRKTKLVLTANNERSVNFYIDITFWPTSKIYGSSRFYLMLHHFILWIVNTESFLKYDFLFKEGYTQFVVLYIFFKEKVENLFCFRIIALHFFSIRHVVLKNSIHKFEKYELKMRFIFNYNLIIKKIKTSYWLWTWFIRC